jgi:putative DNA primase/helicase
MPFAEMTERIRGFGLDDRDDFFLLNHEVLFARTRQSLNLADPIQQRAVLETLKRRGCNLLVFDNLSTGLRGVKENDASDWDPVGAWLLDLRRQGIASLILHHAGRNNEMRGTSRREDPATWVIRLDEDHNRGDASQAQVILRFTKYRTGVREDAEPFALRFREDGGWIRAETTRVDTVDLVVEWVEAGLTSAGDIAAEMGISKGQISKLATRAISAGRLVKRGREYALP